MYTMGRWVQERPAAGFQGQQLHRRQANGIDVSLHAVSGLTRRADREESKFDRQTVHAMAFGR